MNHARLAAERATSGMTTTMGGHAKNAAITKLDGGNLQRVTPLTSLEPIMDAAAAAEN